MSASLTAEGADECNHLQGAGTSIVLGIKISRV